MLTLIFNAIVVSILNYSSYVWGMHEARDMEMVHTTFCRWILGVKRLKNMCGIYDYGELGCVPLITQQKLNMVKFWIKLLNSIEALIAKKVYFMLWNDTNRNISYNNRCQLDSNKIIAGQFRTFLPVAWASNSYTMA